MSRMKRKDYMQLKDERSYLLAVNSDFFIQEAYKTLRTNVLFSLTATEGIDCKTILVTSSMPSEGKSTTAVNLATSYAQTDCKVLLIDCDLRKPRLSRLLNLNAPAGLSNLLIDPNLLDRAILSSKVPGLDVILSGDIPPNPSELLGSYRMRQLLNILKSKYDYIIIDTPPVNVVIDATVLASQSSGVLLVVRANQSERGAVSYALEQLRYAKAKILGFVLNGTDMGASPYFHGKYRNDAYKYYEDSSDAARKAPNPPIPQKRRVKMKKI